MNPLHVYDGQPPDEYEKPQAHTHEPLTAAIRQLLQRHRHRAEKLGKDSCGCEDCRSLQAVLDGVEKEG